jgi:hypothetical protein
MRELPCAACRVPKSGHRPEGRVNKGRIWLPAFPPVLSIARNNLTVLYSRITH